MLKLLPKSVRLALGVVVLYLAVGSLYRIGFWLWFDRAGEGLAAHLVQQALVLGLRFDLRLAILLALPILLLAGFRRLSPFAGPWRSKLWLAGYALLFFSVLLFHVFDAGHYAYLAERLNASIINFAQDADTSAGMVWASYPVIRILLALLALTAACTAAFGWWLRRVAQQADWVLPARRLPRYSAGFVQMTLLVFLLGLGIMGRFSLFPLRWSDATFTQNTFASALVLNPVLQFFDTWRYQGHDYELEAVKSAYPLMAEYLAVDHPDASQLDYRRAITPRADSFKENYNVVVVYLESFSGYKTSLFGNPLATTPNFDALARDGVLFDRYFSASAGTARSVYMGLTAMPDVDVRDTTSRNPKAVQQHLLINSFKGYDKHYFIGASTTWANIRGLLQQNIDNIQIHEEGSFKAPVVDVWGISDKDLFMEANAVFKKADKPFFAIIQTAANHRPYTIPQADIGPFTLRQVDDATLKKNGFIDQAEYNAFRYLDWSVGEFMKTARQEKYFDHTIFVFFGDHGISGDARATMPAAWTDLALSQQHVPFLIYAPGLLKPQRIHSPASEADVMPTLAGLFNRPYVATTIGRDLFDPRYAQSRYAFTINHGQGPTIGLVSDRYYFTMRADGSQAHLGLVDGPDALTDQSAKDPAVALQMKNLTQAIYQTARYMAVNNKVHY